MPGSRASGLALDSASPVCGGLGILGGQHSQEAQESGRDSQARLLGDINTVHLVQASGSLKRKVR